MEGEGAEDDAAAAAVEDLERGLVEEEEEEGRGGMALELLGAKVVAVTPRLLLPLGYANAMEAMESESPKEGLGKRTIYRRVVVCIRPPAP